MKAKLLSEGMEVSITKGPYKGANGIVVRSDCESGYITVRLKNGYTTFVEPCHLKNTK